MLEVNVLCILLIFGNTGKEENMLRSTDKMKAFQRNLQIWKRKAVEGNLQMFLLVNNTCINETISIIFEPLTSLEEKIVLIFHQLTLNNMMRWTLPCTAEEIRVSLSNICPNSEEIARTHLS